MDRITTIDSSGHIPIPEDIRNRHGLEPGKQVHIEERGEEVVISSTSKESESPRKARSMHDMVGFLGKDPKSLKTLMEERRKDREKEDGPFGS
jgi:AbrB family looped-hinge helix DNA binding protein